MAQCFQSVDLSWPGLFGLLLMLLVLLFQAVAFGTNHWGIIDPTIPNPPYSRGYMGVLQWCKDSRCEKYLDNQFLDRTNNIGLTQKTRASATLTMISLLLTFAGLLQIAFSVGRKGKAGVIWDVAIINVFAGCCGMIAFSVFVHVLAELNDDDLLQNQADFSTGYSTGLSIASWVFNWLAAVIFHLESKSLVYMEVQNIREGGRGML